MNNRKKYGCGFLADRRGNIALLTAFLAPAMMLTAGAAVDFLRWTNQSASLKEVSDLLATRGAREFLLANATEANIKAILNAAISNDVGESYNLGKFSHQISVDTVDASVSVTLRQPPRPGLILTKFFPYSEDIETTSTAVARGGTNVCLVALESRKPGAVLAQTYAKLAARDCAIMSNSVNESGIDVSGLASIDAEAICSAGGYKGTILNYKPLPTTDCPVYQDPLIERDPPTVGGCDYNNMEVGDPSTSLTKELERIIESLIVRIDGQQSGTLPGYTRYDLYPGVYCGGLKISDRKADVHLAPGIYVIKDDILHVEKGARIYGENVGFYLDGSSSSFTFEKTSIIHLTAPESGSMAGLLFWEADSVAPGTKHKINSANARQLLGTIYLKNGTLQIQSIEPIADSSAYTAIVVDKLELKGTPTLVLNADYDATTIPVPAGVGPVGGTTYLRE